ncbi:2-dehydro-3-deoxygalactonokinase [Mangrovicoccus sp. HB161399]|uniref:2-dehydro-3-deoxygalactonokinase n=1 Tax=Mangrovicoccus sp. HB161399 TaxID=2720392 RepID=UPI00155723BD|nr:2-dehydro-3-deoxygalactonokinase [Mangrovicoccus sp. HB161399]
MRQRQWIALDTGRPEPRAWNMAEDRAGGPAAALPPGGLTELAGAGGLVVACGPLAGMLPAPLPREVPAAPLPESLPVADWQGLVLAAVPGLRAAGPALMAGAETRAAGFLALNPGWDGVLCIAGEETHWVHVSAGEAVSFQSALSGPLRRAMAAEAAPGPWDEEAFLEALDRTRSRPETLMAGLARIRAAARLGEAAPGLGASQLEGLLIGADLAAARAWWLGQPVAVIAPRERAAPWLSAFRAQGVPATEADDAAMTVAGLAAAWKLLG